MPIKSVKVTIGVLASVLVSGAAVAQNQTEDDRFKPRVYGSLAVTPAQISSETARISGITASRNVIVEPVSTTGATRIIQSSSPTGHYTTSTYRSGDLEAEAQRVIAFQNATTPQQTSGSISETYALQGSEYNVVPQYNENQNRVVIFAQPDATTTYAAPIYASTQTVNAPAQSYATHTVTNASGHVVLDGDTLYGLARRYDTSVDALRSANNLTGNEIRIGQTVTIPSTSRHVIANAPVATSTYGAVQSQTAPSSRLIRTVQPIPSGGVYAVLPKDTLYSISKRACVTVEGIQSQNRLGESTEISPGQRLNMPAGHCLN